PPGEIPREHRSGPLRWSDQKGAPREKRPVARSPRDDVDAAKPRLRIETPRAESLVRHTAAEHSVGRVKSDGGTCKRQIVHRVAVRNIEGFERGDHSVTALRHAVYVNETDAEGRD